jgi:hypothetical protein
VTTDDVQWVVMGFLAMLNGLQWMAWSAHDSRMDRIQGLRRQ